MLQYGLPRLLGLPHQIREVPDLCCIVTRRLVVLVGGIIDLIVNSASETFKLKAFEIPF